MSFIDDILEPNIRGIPIIFIVVALLCGLIFLVIIDGSIK